MTFHTLKLRISPMANSLFRLVTVLLISLEHSILGADGRIVFHSDRVGNYEIHAVEVDRTNLVRLTKNPAYDISPTCSLDGRKIAFVSDRTGNFEIFVMNPDGTNPLRLTNDPARDDTPCWSPNGIKIAFQSWRDNHAHFEIYTMNTNGNQILRLTEGNGANVRPSWSPNGRKIAYMSDRAGDWSIYVMDADGQNPVRLTEPPPDAWDSSPCWLSGAFAVASQGKLHTYWGAIKQTGILFDSHESKTDNEARTKE